MKSLVTALITVVAGVTAISFPGTEVQTSTTTSYTTTTVYTTTTYTVTSCAPVATECPEIGSVVTHTISLYTTSCPATIPVPTASVDPDQASTLKSHKTGKVEKNIWHTVTDCAVTATNCTVGRQTSSVPTYTVDYPQDEESSFADRYLKTRPPLPQVTGHLIASPKPPKSNITVPIVPPNTVDSGAPAQKLGSLLVFFCLSTATSALLYEWVW